MKRHLVATGLLAAALTCCSVGQGWSGFGGDSIPAAPLPRRPAKSPLIACGLSYLLPGAGQFYNEEPEKGLMMLGAAGYGAGLMVLAAALGSAGDYRDPERHRRLSIVSYLGAGLYLGAGIWSMVDAPVSAMEANRRAGRVNLLLRPAPAGLGLAVCARL